MRCCAASAVQPDQAIAGSEPQSDASREFSRCSDAIPQRKRGSTAGAAFYCSVTAARLLRTLRRLVVALAEVYSKSEAQYYAVTRSKLTRTNTGGPARNHILKIIFIFQQVLNPSAAKTNNYTNISKTGPVVAGTRVRRTKPYGFFRTAAERSPRKTTSLLSVGRGCGVRNATTARQCSSHTASTAIIVIRRLGVGNAFHPTV